MTDQISDRDFREKSVGELYKQVKLPVETIMEISKQGDDEIEKLISQKSVFERKCCDCKNYEKGHCLIRAGKRSDGLLPVNENEMSCNLWEDNSEKKRQKMREIYFAISDVLKYYLDMREEYYPLVALWILGTYFYKEFDAYPYLFINAMRGSGKTRLLKLIAELSYNGELTTNLSEAVLFRTASNTTHCIDEFEQIGSREKQTLRELLNAGYKKGMKVKRMAKGTVKDEETGKEKERMVVEEFELYSPIVMANIWGMDEILGDRCITLVLEKSNDPEKTRLIEDFKTNFSILAIKTNFSEGSVVYDGKNNQERAPTSTLWNEYIHTLHTQHTQHTLPSLLTLTPYKPIINIPPQETKVIDHFSSKFFEKVEKTGINGRNLELFFSLFVLADRIGEDLLDKIIEISKRIIIERKLEEKTESRDVLLIKFIASQIPSETWISIKSMFKEFAEWLNESATPDFPSPEWLGKALKRLNLTKDKRRLNRGIEVMINYTKALEKARIWS